MTRSDGSGTHQLPTSRGLRDHLLVRRGVGPTAYTGNSGIRVIGMDTVDPRLQEMERDMHRGTVSLGTRHRQAAARSSRLPGTSRGARPSALLPLARLGYVDSLP